jgi:phage baseplate assembly protein gpV
VTGAATAAEIEIYDGARVDYNSSGTITTLEAFGGTFSLLDNTTSSVTITNSTMYEGSTLRLDNSLQNVTLANPMTIQGGDLRLPPGSEITLG